MIKEIKEMILSKTTWIIVGAAAAVSVIYGFIVSPFRLKFLNCFAIIGFAVLLAGLIRETWKDGGWVLFSWRPHKGSYSEYRDNIAQQRDGKKNPLLYAGLIIVIIDTILAFMD